MKVTFKRSVQWCEARVRETGKPEPSLATVTFSSRQLAKLPDEAAGWISNRDGFLDDPRPALQYSYSATSGDLVYSHGYYEYDGETLSIAEFARLILANRQRVESAMFCHARDAVGFVGRYKMIRDSCFVDRPSDG